MIWNQTHSRRLDIHGFGEAFGDSEEDSLPVRKESSPVHGMKLEKVQPLVARFLGISSDEMPKHFYPASLEHLPQILEIRQQFITQSARDDEAYLRWRYDFTPENTSGNKIWVFTKDEAILGFVGVESAELMVEGKPTKVIKVMDLVVKPEVDRKGLGVWMNLTLQNMGLPIIALGSNRNSLGIMSKLYHRMPNQRFFKNVLRSNEYFRARIQNPVLAGMLSWTYDISFPLLLGSKAISSGRRLTLQRIERFKPEDDASLAAMDHGDIHFKRDARYLNWRLVDTPRDNVELLGLRDGRQLIGYLALALREPRPGKLRKWAFLLDWGALPRKDCQRSLAAALIQCQRKLRKEGVESISAFSYNSASDNLLRRAGLHVREDDTKTVSLFASAASTLSTLKQADKWFLSGADTDYA